MVGEGDSKLAAERNALKSFAEYFETNISSETRTSKTAFQTSDGDAILTSEVSEEIWEQVRAITNDVVLKGVEFRERYEKGDDVFIFASLNKRKTGRIMRNEIDTFDDKLKAYLKENKRSRYRKLVKLYEGRERLNNHYGLLVGKNIPKRVSFDQIHALKLNRGGQNQVVYVQIRNQNGSDNKELLNLIVQSLTANNYKVVTDSKREATIKIFGRLVAKKQFLKVEGFVKYKYTLQLQSRNSEGEKVGALSISDVAVGRGQSKTYELAMKKITNLILNDDRLSDLELVEGK